ncbi:hypothetical protein NHX12_011255 [Muraenolepis orangiensis]|uniref:Uncharacterized protein n=1 Tax=Muraenolepis orangiensis TaxID=630683 RepID=A0A9Q0DHH8_9TELE|nr:hypothetical protein NHX12_011255 [Muraenolepis orangiensis]
MVHFNSELPQHVGDINILTVTSQWEEGRMHGGGTNTPHIALQRLCRDRAGDRNGVSGINKLGFKGPEAMKGEHLILN